MKDNASANDSPASIQKYFDQANSGRNAWWHWAVGACFVVLIYVGFAIPIVLISLALLDSLAVTNEEATAFRYEVVSLITLLVSFLPLWIGVWWVQTKWFGRPFGESLITSASRIRWGYVVRAAAVTFVVLVVDSVCSSLLTGESQKISINSLPMFLLGLLIFLPLVPVQAASEELVFRGFLNQSLIGYLKSPWVTYLVTSLLFAWLHIGNSEAENNTLPFLVAIFGYGIACCVLLHFEGGLESAIGLHVCNNLVAFSLFSAEDPDLPELSLFVQQGLATVSISDAAESIFCNVLIVVIVIFWNRRADQRQEKLA